MSSNNDNVLNNENLLNTLKEKFDKLPPGHEITSYTCIDCDKDLGDLCFPNEYKETLPLGLDGSFAVICNECAISEDYSKYNDYI